MSYHALANRILLRTPAASPRRYIAQGFGVDGFSRALNATGISYVVLRWFELLPAIEPGEGLDLLIADEDLVRVGALLKGNLRHGIPCDIYTVSGLPGTDYDGVPYFPPTLAQEVLDTSVLASSGVRVPDVRHHLLTMAYHALLHKGYLSGLPTVAGAQPRYTTPEHDYRAVLTRLALECDVVHPQERGVNMSLLRDFLMDSHWLPPIDTLKKLARENNWVQDAFFSGAKEDPVWDGFAVFIVQERGVSYLPLVRDILREAGFNLLSEVAISPSVRRSLATQVRGGNWDCGPWLRSGGRPAHALVMLDLFPRQPAKALLDQHFGLANERTHRATLRVRDTVNAELDPRLRCNVIHSSDNTRQALHYFSLLHPAAAEREGLKSSVRELRDRVASPWPVKRVAGNSDRHAIVRVVDYEGAWVVCKTFRPGCERSLELELLAREIATGMPEVLEVLVQKGLHVLFPLCTCAPRRRFFTAVEMEHIRRVIRHFRAVGYELPEFSPDNVIRDRDCGLRVLDLDCMQVTEPRDGIVGCQCWYGIPMSDEVSDGVARTSKSSRYYRLWYDRTGLPLWMAAHEVPRWSVPLVQFVVRGTFAAKRFAKHLRDVTVAVLQC